MNRTTTPAKLLNHRPLQATESGAALPEFPGPGARELLAGGTEAERRQEHERIEWDRLNMMDRFE